MNFLSPASLFLFGLAVPILALYILKLRRRREPVSTLLFWEQLFRERQTTSLFQRLKHLLSLLLQLLFLALLVLAIGQPQFAFITKSARQVVLIIDHSASMNTVEEPEGITRLESAKQHALRTVESLRFMDTMTVMSSHKRPLIHTPFTNHQKSLREAIHAIQPTDIGTDLDPALELAEAIARTKPNPEITVLSDFQAVSEAFLAKRKATTETREDTEPHIPEIKPQLVRIGKASDNVGITQFRVRKSLVNPFDYETLLRVVNASKAEKQFNVELYFSTAQDPQTDQTENLFDVRPYTLAPGESTSEIFRNFAFEGGKLKAVLAVQDALATDNVAYATLPKREYISVLLVTAENPFLQKALTVDEQIQLTHLTPAEYERETHSTASAAGDVPANLHSQEQQKYQVVIFDRYSPPTLGTGNYMFIYPPPPSPAFASSDPRLNWDIGEGLETPIITEWERDHPILRHVHLENVQIGEAYRVTPPATAQILARSFEDPVLFVDTAPTRKIVFAAIDILQSDLPLRIAFPVIIANTIQWFQQGTRIEEYYLQTGEVLKHRIEPIAAIPQSVRKDGADSSADPVKDVKITGPKNKSWDISTEHGEVLFDQTEIAGFYELALKTASPSDPIDTTPEKPLSAAEPATENNSGTVWAVNLADETEAHIGTDPAVEPLLTDSRGPDTTALFRYPPWVYLVCLAVGLSAVEWFLYQRRRID